MSPALRRPLLLLCLVMVLATLGGCAFMSDEDRDFYGRGWVKPTDLDQPYPHHSTPSVANTSTPVDSSSAPLSTTSDPAHDSAWDVPGDHPR